MIRRLTLGLMVLGRRSLSIDTSLIGVFDLNIDRCLLFTLMSTSVRLDAIL
jgi:hypothetical protein